MPVTRTEGNSPKIHFSGPPGVGAGSKPADCGTSPIFRASILRQGGYGAVAGAQRARGNGLLVSIEFFCGWWLRWKLPPLVGLASRFHVFTYRNLGGVSRLSPPAIDRPTEKLKV